MGARSSKTIAELFWSHVDKNGPVVRPELGPCWVWTAFKSRRGYGQMMIARKPVGAHRVSFALANGPIADGVDVLHRCDNRACVRPTHLFDGNAAINLADMVAKRRQCKGAVHRAPVIQLAENAQPSRAGENGYQHLLTERMVIYCCRRYREGVSAAVLALELGVSKNTIWKAVTGRTWKHVKLQEAA